MRIVVGEGSCGIATGAKKTAIEFEKQIKDRKIKNVTVSLTGCVGTCFLEPIVDVYDDDGKMTRYTKVLTAKVNDIIESHILKGKVIEDYEISEKDSTFVGKQTRIVLRNCGIINPEVIDEYLAIGGYEATKKVITSMTQEEVIEEIKISGLRGRGGAGFPTWFKWDAARKSPETPKYMVCNADEGDPGAFMDRSVLEGDPHSLIEGMTIGAFAMGASEGIIYVRAEYPLAIHRLEIAMDQARERGFLGKNLFGSGFNFDLRIKAGAGAFVCGEETALIASLEGERGMPRLKPPFPAQKGYWQKPTNINNVETFANVTWIIMNGGKAFGAMGTKLSKGTKVFALAGKIKKGGLVEVPMGLPLREVIYGKDGDIELLQELAYKIKDGSMCGLGQTAPNPVLTTIKYFRNEYEDHIYKKKCTARACKALLTFTINDKCIGCTLCAKKCPVEAIEGKVKIKHVIDQDKCIKCGKCEETCKFGAIERY